ncbi:proteasome subunit beta type-3-like [Drosophila innubila]|uniref:proteasome subunit beta type-3-like n=1 Tax=Drosophila innubila TaxID=198719 RepID=UPI00148B3826|nr:proteasome subunit beta type-3-like [Drosophila innubila]
MEKASNVVAMLGKNCLGIVSEHRNGPQAQTETATGTVVESSELSNIFKFGERLLVCFSGLSSDITTVRNQLSFRKDVYELREMCNITPIALTNILSNYLYEHRFAPFFIESIVAGLDQNTMEPYICSMDLFGQRNVAKDFAVVGSGSKQLYGVFQTLWRPNLEPHQLFDNICQSMISAMDRDVMSAWSSIVMILESDKLTERTIKGRVD